MTEVFQCNQPAPRQLSHHPVECCHITGPMFVSAAGRLGNQQWPQSALKNGNYAKSSSLPPWPSVWEPTVWWPGDWGKRLTGIHKIGHPINLITVIILCWGHSLVSTHIRHKYLHSFCTFREIYLDTYTPNFFVTNFPVMTLPSSCPLSQSVGYCHESVYNHISGHIFFQAKYTARCTVQVWHTREDLPSPLSFRDIPEKGCSATAVHFQMVLACHAGPSVFQAWIFSPM